jgi:Putative DNA-binding domain
MNFFSADLDSISFTGVEDFLAIKAPIEQRPPEGLRIDYKLKEPTDLSETVAAFANTFGGLLFIGVDSKRTKHNFPISLPGETFPGGDIKARITGKIISQVTPRPEFSVGVAPLPSQSDRAVAVVRVVAGVWPPYEFNSSNTVRIPVRIQDTNRQAPLREIEQLIQRRASFSQSPDERLSAINESKPLNPAFIGADEGTGPQSHSAQAYQTWIIRPRSPLRLRLDRAFDSAVRSEISAQFDEPGNFYPPLMAGDSHVIRWQARISSEQLGVLTCVRNLEFTGDGSLRYSEKMDRHERGEESVSDPFIQSLKFLRFAETYYHTRGYFGSLSVLQRIDSTSDIQFRANFPDHNGSYHGTNAIAFTGEERGRARGSSRVVREVESLGPGENENLVVDFMLSHLRQLCQASVDTDALREIIKNLPARSFFPFF